MAGIEIRADASWGVLAILIAWSMYAQFSGIWHVGALVGAVLAVLATALFFGSVLVHELAHSVTSRLRGIPVRDITLFLFGGATRARVESKGPGDEFLVTAVGPVASVLLAGLFWLGPSFGRGLPAHLSGMLAYLALVNLLLAGFNLVPGFPLDGGRLFRSAAWKVTGDFRRATRAATYLGVAVGALLVLGGLALIATRAFLGGTWLALIGLFLAHAARASWRDARMRMLLEGARAADVMAVDPWRGVSLGDVRGRHDGHVTVSPQEGMARVLTELEEGEARSVLVAEGGDMVGVITPADISRWLRAAERAGRTSAAARRGDRGPRPGERRPAA